MSKRPKKPSRSGLLDARISGEARCGSRRRPNGHPRHATTHPTERSTMAAPITDVDSLWNVDAVARRLGVQVRHIRRLVAERRIPYVKWGHLLRFDPAEIEAWLDRARRPPQAG